MKWFCGRLFQGTQFIIVIFSFTAILLIFDCYFSGRSSLRVHGKNFYSAYIADERRLQSINDEAADNIDPSSLTNEELLLREKRTSTFSAFAEYETDDPENTLATVTPFVVNVTAAAKKKEVYSDTIFFRTATLITEAKRATGVRITSLQECGNKRITKFRIGTSEVSLKKTTVTKKCPWFFAPKCHLVGYYATGTFDQKAKLPLQMPNFAEIYDDRKEIWKRIDLIDGRSSPTHPHRLAVCLQPVYLMAEWPLIPNFFETWIGNGATIFYIYIHSISEEVDLMLRMYEAQLEIEVVRVNWPAVPSSEADDDDRNPNNRMYRTEVATAVNDCILRARATADYVASSDLDEIIAPLNVNGKNETLLDIIEEYQKQKLPKGRVPSAFLFRHSYAYAENDWFSISHPSQLSFEHYQTISYEKKVWPKGYRSKVVYIPDRLYRAHVHDVVQFESGKFGVVTVDPKRARLLHFRQVNSKAMKANDIIANSTVLQEASEGWQDAYSSRVDAAMEWDGTGMQLDGVFNLTFAAEEWPNLGEKVLKEIERCRDKKYELKKNKCATEWGCRASMTTVRPGQWVEPDSSKAWTVI